MSEGDQQLPSGEFIQSLARGLAVIRAFSDERDMLTLANVARTAGLSRASARRSLLTLETLGYVGSREGRFYLRPRVLDLGYAFLSSSSAVEITQENLRQLSDRLHESCSACEYDNGDVVYVARAAVDSVMPIRVGIGRRLPAFCTSTGKVLLSAFSDADLDDFFERYPREKHSPMTITDEGQIRAQLAEIRERGWSLNDQELELGGRSVAAPIVSPTGEFLSAVNVTVSTSRVSIEQLIEEYLPPLLETTKQISDEVALVHGHR